jgi:hypothetical protein
VQLPPFCVHDVVSPVSKDGLRTRFCAAASTAMDASSAATIASQVRILIVLPCFVPGGTKRRTRVRPSLPEAMRDVSRHDVSLAKKTLPAAREGFS